MAHLLKGARIRDPPHRFGRCSAGENRRWCYVPRVDVDNRSEACEHKRPDLPIRSVFCPREERVAVKSRKQNGVENWRPGT
jgi:hypothetical protein